KALCEIRLPDQERVERRGVRNDAAMSTTRKPIPQMPEPEWEVARLFPARGEWSEDEYLDLSTNHLVEFSNGRLEVLSRPTQSHQLIAFFLSRLFAAFVEARALGMVLPAELPLRLWRRKFREPDVVFMRAENAHRRHEKYWEGADLVMEVVSPDP